MELFDRSVGKTDAVAAIARFLEMDGVNPWAGNVGDVIKQFEPALDGRNPQFFIAPAADLGFEDRLMFASMKRRLVDPLHFTESPDCFPKVSGLIDQSPPVTILGVSDGILWNFEESSVALTGDGRSVIEDYSSKYCGISQFYDFNFQAIKSEARYIDGTVFSLIDDIWPPNFCHWLVDTLPRLAAIGHESTDSNFFVATRQLNQAYQFDTLEMCGISRDRIVEVPRFEAIRAKNLLLTSDIRSMPHPCFKSAPWAIDFLRSKLGVNALLKDRHTALAGVGRKIYISRDDAPGRKIVNDAEVFAYLSDLGFDRVVMSDLPFYAQVQCLAGATHIVSLHGAALSHLALAMRPSSVLEIFPKSYGTPAFYAIAASLGNSYATYVADAVVQGAYSQIDDIMIDVDRFKELTSDFLS